MKILFNICYYAFVLAIVALGSLLLATLAPIPGRVEVKIVQSGSMEPTIKTGSIIVIRPVQSYAPGDIVTFGKDTKTQIPTTHRIVSIDGGMITTKGDANDVADPNPTRLSEIKGKVLFSVPYVGFVLDFARKPLGFALLVGIPAIFIIADEALKIVGEVLRMRHRKSRRSQLPVRKGVRRRQAEPERVVKKLVVNGKVKEPDRPSYARHLTTKAICLAVILSSFSSLSHLGGTLSYAVDAETSKGNSFQAGIVDIELKKVEEVGRRAVSLDSSAVDVGSTSFDLALEPTEGSMPLAYTIDAELDPTNPEGCNTLYVRAKTAEDTYEGPLSLLSLNDITDAEIASFEIEIDEEDVAYDAICRGTIVAKAELMEPNEDMDHVYVDEEKYAFAVQNVSAPIFVPTEPVVEPIAETPAEEPAAEVSTEPVAPPAEEEPEPEPESQPEPASETPAA